MPEESACRFFVLLPSDASSMFGGLKDLILGLKLTDLLMLLGAVFFVIYFTVRFLWFLKNERRKDIARRQGAGHFGPAAPYLKSGREFHLTGQGSKAASFKFKKLPLDLLLSLVVFAVLGAYALLSFLIVTLTDFLFNSEKVSEFFINIRSGRLMLPVFLAAVSLFVLIALMTIMFMIPHISKKFNVSSGKRPETADPDPAGAGEKDRKKDEYDPVIKESGPFDF